MNYDGIIFDLDGTLWDSGDGVAKTWEAIIKTLPEDLTPPTLEEIGGIMGLTPENVMKKLFPQLSLQRGLELFDLFSSHETVYLSEHGGRLYPGLTELLEALSEKLPLFIVSNCAKGYIEAFLTAHDAYKYFKDWECIGNNQLRKSDNIELIVSRNDLKNPVYVGDTRLDYTEASAAGVPFIHAAYGFGGEIPDVPVIDNPHSLINLI